MLTLSVSLSHSHAHTRTHAHTHAHTHMPTNNRMHGHNYWHNVHRKHCSTQYSNFRSLPGQWKATRLTFSDTRLHPVCENWCPPGNFRNDSSWRMWLTTSVWVDNFLDTRSRWMHCTMCCLSNGRKGTVTVITPADSSWWYHVASLSTNKCVKSSKERLSLSRPLFKARKTCWLISVPNELERKKKIEGQL